MGIDLSSTIRLSWTSLPGPQKMALECEADELYYGGGAGGGKSDLLLGYGLSQSRAGIIFRRQFKQLEGPEGLIERSKRIVGRSEHFNGSRMIWRLGERMLEFGAVDHEDDKEKYQGRAHDFKGFDELTQFSESQYLYLNGWARTTTPGQRVRTIACGNPPQTAEGEWVIQRWAAWLDPQYGNPAVPGEVRWYARIDGKDTEVDGADAFEYKGETIKPRSRTFIPARVTDNPYLMATDYTSQLQNMPEPLRSQLLYGDHSIGLMDAAFQVIPTSWVRAAQQRWHDGRVSDEVTAIGTDVAQGGSDLTTFAPRYGDWVDRLEQIPGEQVPDAQINATHVTRVLTNGGYAVIDIDGIGASTYFLLKPSAKHRVRPFAGSAPTTWRDRARLMFFRNTRAAAYWNLREMLDPSSSRQIALPPGQRLLADLTAPRWFKAGDKVQLEKKEDIHKRLGRSPDEGDAVVMAFWDDPTAGAASAWDDLSATERPLTKDEASMPWNKRAEEERAVPWGGR